VADHDFTRFSTIPSVVFEVNIPAAIAGSWYDGNVHVLYKDAAFEPSCQLDMLLSLCQFSEAKA